MIGNGLLTLLAAAVWLYGLYLALTRTKSPTARAVVAVALVGLFLGTGGIGLNLDLGGGRGYPYTRQEERRLPGIRALDLAVTNAEAIVRPGDGRLTLVYRAKSRAALARMHPRVRVEDGRLVVRDDRQPRGTVYRFELGLRAPVVARIALTNGELKAEDRLASLDFSATNGEVRLRDYRPTGPTVLGLTNGEVEILGFAPEAATRINLTNGEVRIRAERPLRVRARVTNGAIRLPGATHAAAGGAEVTYGPDQAPPILVRILNGELDYREANP